MDSLVRFHDLKEQGDNHPVTTRQAEGSQVPAVIEHLRQRLFTGSYGDSVEMRVAVLGELVYRCYMDLLKRRYL